MTHGHNSLISTDMNMLKVYSIRVHITNKNSSIANHGCSLSKQETNKQQTNKHIKTKHKQHPKNKKQTKIKQNHSLANIGKLCLVLHQRYQKKTSFARLCFFWCLVSVFFVFVVVDAFHVVVVLVAVGAVSLCYFVSLFLLLLLLFLLLFVIVTVIVTFVHCCLLLLFVVCCSMLLLLLLLLFLIVFR